MSLLTGFAISSEHPDRLNAAASERDSERIGMGRGSKTCTSLLSCSSFELDRPCDFQTVLVKFRGEAKLRTGDADTVIGEKQKSVE